MLIVLDRQPGRVCLVDTAVSPVSFFALAIAFSPLIAAVVWESRALVGVEDFRQLALGQLWMLVALAVPILAAMRESESDPSAGWRGRLVRGVARWLPGARRIELRREGEQLWFGNRQVPSACELRITKVERGYTLELVTGETGTRWPIGASPGYGWSRGVARTISRTLSLAIDDRWTGMRSTPADLGDRCLADTARERPGEMPESLRPRLRVREFPDGTQVIFRAPEAHVGQFLGCGGFLVVLWLVFTFNVIDGERRHYVALMCALVSGGLALAMITQGLLYALTCNQLTIGPHDVIGGRSGLRAIDQGWLGLSLPTRQIVEVTFGQDAVPGIEQMRPEDLFLFGGTLHLHTESRALAFPVPYRLDAVEAAWLRAVVEHAIAHQGAKAA